MTQDFRFYLTIIVMTLCVLDLVFTFYYVYTYKNWQPEKPYNLIEMNPLLVFLWKRMGLYMGMFVGAVIILSLNWIVVRYAHWSIALVVCLFLCWAMYNHAYNTQLLWKLIKLYPTGVLPASFGIVQGNNILKGDKK